VGIQYKKLTAGQSVVKIDIQHTGTKVNPVAALKFALKHDLGTPTVGGAAKHDGSLVTTSVNLSMVVNPPELPLRLANQVFLSRWVYPDSCLPLPVQEVQELRQACWSLPVG